MRHLDLSFHGKLLAESNQLDNGRLPHGGHKGSKKHPPSHLSYDKGREFQQKLEEELSRIMEHEEWARHGGSPPWSIAVHNSPSYTDESPLFTNNLMAASKLEQVNGINMYNRQSLLPGKTPKPARSGALTYYRPNRMHQYLSATELKNSASEDPNLKYGRPTRTTLLRARQRSNSAPSNQLEKKKEFTQRLDELKTAPAASNPNTEYLQLQSVRDGESLHSYLTGARYNRAHCLDSKSVEHSGVYMPRHNPALGCFFTGPKGQEYLQDFAESPRQDMPTPPSPPTPKRRPLTAPSYGRRPVQPPAPVPIRREQQPGSSKYKYLKLNIVGSRLPLVGTREPFYPGLRLPKLSETANLSDRRLEEAVDQTYLVNQPQPSPRLMGDSSPYSKQSKFESDGLREVGILEPERGLHRDDLGDMGAIRIEGRSTWRKPLDSSQPMEPEAQRLVSVPAAVVEEASLNTKPEEEKEEIIPLDEEIDEEREAANINESVDVVESEEQEAPEKGTKQAEVEVEAEQDSGQDDGQEVAEVPEVNPRQTELPEVEEAELTVHKEEEEVEEVKEELEDQEKEEEEEIQEHPALEEDQEKEEVADVTETLEKDEQQIVETEADGTLTEQQEEEDASLPVEQEEEVAAEEAEPEEPPEQTTSKEVRFFITEDGGPGVQVKESYDEEDEEAEQES